MEKHIGRELTKEEVVHHIDKDKSNNELDNLMLFPTQRAHVKFHFELGGYGFNGFNKKKLIDGKLKCNACGEIKKIEDFPKESKHSYGVRGNCNLCYNKQVRDRKKKNKTGSL